MISIVIPVLNEAETIEDLLQHISENVLATSVSEIVVVDGGSDDNSRDIVTRFADNSLINVVSVSSNKGRAKQMNAGAKISTGRILYFLHADSYPPNGFDSLIISEVEKGNSAGCFRLKFDSNHPVLRISQWFTRFNFNFCRGGDQSLFVTRNAFDELNGYNESYTIYEDCEFINRIYAKYKFVIINDRLTTSARKYEQQGTVKLQYHFFVIHLKKMFGASAETLSQYYQKHIAS
ncbi:MAG: TIGR04283 family arsenosugar biosynthesis glycosyltransferase [Bacteroidetes bacterium]|nr:TIGR04283 family arsenosugar biosynthesis glycosyltransferase [Bacteroidota bacterium]